MLWKYAVEFKDYKQTMEIFEGEGLKLHFVSYFEGRAMYKGAITISFQDKIKRA